MKFVKLCYLVMLLTPSWLAAPARAKDNPQVPLEGFNIAAEPSRADWRYFVRSPEPNREKLWAYHVTQGKHLKDWSWGWRLGWVRVCGASHRPLCVEILREALGDKAVVVRAEAATRMGRLYEGSGDEAVVTLLAQAYRNSRNLRHGRPLFVQSRILFAIHQIGGDAALATGRALADAHPEARGYWAKLTVADNKL